ncbi:MAG: alpha/beta hydrolase [Henriciella sp.]
MLHFAKSTVLAAALASLTACGAPGPAPDMNSATDSTDAIFTSAHFEVAVQGTGPDVILIPGLASDAAVWDSVTEALDDTYRFHVVQVSGFAGSPARANAENTSVLKSISNDLAEYTQGLETPPAIIGHSLGGLLALETGLDPDAKASRLMVIDVLPFFSVLIDEAATAQSIEPIASMARIVLIGQTDEAFATGQTQALKGLVKDEDGLETALSWSIASDRKVMAQAMYEVMVLDLREAIASLDTPLTVLFARDSSLPDMDKVEGYYRDLYAAAPQSEVVAIDDAYHFIMFDQSAAFIEAVEAFLSPE